MSSLVRRIAIAAALASPLAAPQPTGAFALIGSADILVEPNNFWSFDGSEITWKFTDNFLAAFPDAALQNQVRLAFEEWSIASASAERRASPRYHWVRSDGARIVYDLRSTMTHEIGHAIGSQHPDASWFNSGLQKNFRYDGGVLVAAPPVGGEIMNEGYQPGTLPASKPGTGIAPGEYWRTVSKDELLFLDHAYDRKLTFTQVAGDDPAMITITAYNLDGTSGSGALGQTFDYTSEARVPGDASQGRRIIDVKITINANPTNGCLSCSMGIDPSTSGWDVVNSTGKAIDGLSIRGQGTSNPQPLLVVISNDPNRFTTYEPSNAVELFNFENRGHRFTDPVGGSIPNGGSFGIAMQQDVWDWTATAATARATDGDFIPLSVITFLPFFGLSLAPAGAPSVPEPPGLSILEGDLGAIVAGRGLKLVNSDKATRVTGIAFADVEGLGIGAREVLLATWDRLMREARVHELSFTPFELGAFEEFYLVFEGGLDALPRDVRARGNYMLLDFPGLLDREIFAWARGIDGDFVVQSMGLINDEPIVGRLVAPVPAPPTLLLLAPVLLALRRRRRA